MRVNRIPTALRKARMGELFAKYHETVGTGRVINTGASVRAQGRVLASPSKNLMQEHQSQTRHSPSPMRPAKRMRYGFLENKTESYHANVVFKR